MNRERAALSAALVVLSLASISPPARAEYCRTKACDNHIGYDDVWQTEPDPPCTVDANDCRLEGQELYWPNACLSFAVQQDGSKKQGIDYATFHDIVDQAFTTWLRAECPTGGPPALRVDDLGSVVCNRPEYNTDQGNANVFTFRDKDWPHQEAFATIALTTVTYNRENAQIFDADVEINSHLQTFSTGDEPVGEQVDLLAVLTHETGHFLGLSHDSDENAAMWKRYKLGQRELHESDVRGICDIFPPDQPISDHECGPHHGYQRTCAVPQTGCAISPDGANGARSFGLLVLAGSLLAHRRVRRRVVARR